MWNEEESYYRGDCPSCGDDMFNECDLCECCDDCCACEIETLENGVEVKSMEAGKVVSLNSKESGIDLRDIIKPS